MIGTPFRFAAVSQTATHTQCAIAAKMAQVRGAPTRTSCRQQTGKTIRRRRQRTLVASGQSSITDRPEQIQFRSHDTRPHRSAENARPENEGPWLLCCGGMLSIFSHDVTVYETLHVAPVFSWSLTLILCFP